MINHKLNNSYGQMINYDKLCTSDIIVVPMLVLGNETTNQSNEIANNIGIFILPTGNY